MTWNATFPTGATLISQSVNQIQTNWGFLATNINTDHYFNAVTVANEGHHKYVQFVNQGGDAAVARNAVLYSKVDGSGNTQPWFRNASIIAQVPVLFTTTLTFGAPGTASVNLSTCNAGGALPFFIGSATIVQDGGSANCAYCPVAYVTGGGMQVMAPNVSSTFGIVKGINSSNQITNITGGATTFTFTSSVAATYSIYFLMYPI